MNAKDRKQFQVALSKTKVSLPGPNLTTEELILRDQVFFEELQPYPIEKIEEAFKTARRELLFFPTPSKILEYLGPIKSNVLAIEHKTQEREERMDPEEAKACLRKIYAEIDIRGVEQIKPKPTLEGSQALDFEKRRREVKEKFRKQLKEMK